jgi:hypothetical protein
MAGRTLRERFRSRLAEAPPGKAVAPAGSPAPPPAMSKVVSLTILARVDLKQKLAPAEYDRRLAKAQGKLGRLVRAAFEKKRSSVVVFEGWDASGKGGNIRRITAAMDPRTYRVISVAAPTDEEKAHHYLWRFWRHVPRAGYVTLYDRSWYGRVMVERVEGFARPEEWSRAYLEINDFEHQLIATASCSRSSGCTWTRRSSCAAFANARRWPGSGTRSGPRTGATGRSGPSTRRRPPT